MLFSKRNKAEPARLTYEITDRARARILYTIPDLLARHPGLPSADLCLADLAHKIGQEYGYPARPVDRQFEAGPPAAVHFLWCDDEKALDFIELIFRHPRYRAEQNDVDRINTILREEGIGYEFTPWRVARAGTANLYGHELPAYYTDYPQARKRGEEYLEETAVRPCLQALADPRFATANDELMTAFQAARKGEDDDAITACGAAFETVLKTICTVKGWAYDPHKYGCADLVKVCKDNDLFPGFYAPIFGATGTIRNKLGDAHGKGPAPLYEVGPANVEHAIQLTCAH